MTNGSHPQLRDLPPLRVAQNTHLFVLFFRLSMSSLRKRNPSWCAVCVGGCGTAGLLWAGADLDRRVVSPGSLGRGLRLGLGLSRARGRSGREVFSGKPLGRRGTSPRACGAMFDSTPQNRKVYLPTEAKRLHSVLSKGTCSCLLSDSCRLR